MADLQALREFVYDLMQKSHNGQVLSPNKVYTQLDSAFGNAPPVHRTTFYKWFGQSDTATPVTALLLECIPALAPILGTTEYELYQVAALFPKERDASAALLEAARDFRSTLRLANRLLSTAGLSTSGEALIVDRILHHKLDYRVVVWPVVRGTARPLHLRSWISLQPVESDPARRRPQTRELEAMPPSDQRKFIREKVIGDYLWSSFGLRWRDPAPLEWPVNERSHLRIEMPVEERNREPQSDAVTLGGVCPSRILAVSGLWGRGETLIAMLAEGLHWGSYDLRYQGSQLDQEAEDKRRLVIEKLSEDAPHYAWALAEDATFTRSVADEVVSAAATHLLVVITTGPAVKATAAKAWGTNQRAVQAAENSAWKIAVRVNMTYPVIHVAYSDDDLQIDPSTHNSPALVDVNQFIDHVRYSAAEILNRLHERHGAPSIERWGNRFSDLGHAGRYARIPKRRTTVNWRDAGTLRRA